MGPAAPTLQRRRTTAFLCPGSGPSKRCTNITCSNVCTCCVCDHGPPLCFCCLCWVTAPLQCRPAGHFCCPVMPMSPAESSPMRCFYISPTTIEPSLNTKQRSIFRAGRPTRPRCLARRSLPAGAPIIQRVLTHAATVSAAWQARGAAQRLPCKLVLGLAGRVLVLMPHGTAGALTCPWHSRGQGILHLDPATRSRPS